MAVVSRGITNIYNIISTQTMKKVLASNHLQKLLEHKYDILNEFKKIHYDEFCKYLLKVKNLDDVNAYKVNGISNHLNRLAVFHHRPIDQIVYTYQKSYYKGFDQDIIAMNIKTLGSIFQSFQKDGMLYSGNERPKEFIFFEERFSNVMNDARFAFQENTYVSNRNLGHIVRGMTQMGYVEREFLELVMEKLSGVAKGDESSEIDPSKNYYQMNKNYYYAQGEIINRNKLLNSESFNSILEEIVNSPELKKESSHQVEVKDEERNITEQEFLVEEDERKIEELISSINQELDSTSKNLSQFVESILSLRLKYVDMVKATSNVYIASDPNLNTQLLQLQESLLQFKLIKLQEIKDHSVALDKDQFLKNSKQIIYQYLSNPQENMTKYLDLVLEKFQTIKVNTVKVPSNINKEVLYFGKLVQEISSYLNAQTKEIRRDGLIQSKWKSKILDYSTVLPQFAASNTYQQHSYSLCVDRGFKHVYQLFIEYMNEKGLEEHIAYVKKATNPLSGICYAKALIDLGLADKALDLVRDLNISNIKLVDSNPSREQIIDLVSFISTFSDLPQFHELNQQLIQIISGYVKEQKFLQTKWKVAEGGYGWGIYELCTVINWLQNTSHTNTPLFNQLVDLLKEQQFQISSLHLHRYHGMISSVLSPGQQIAGSNYDTLKHYNPAMLVVKQKILKHLSVLNSEELGNQELIPYGFMDIENQLLNYLVFIPSIMSSNDGKYIDHNLKAHYKRMERVKKIRVTPIPFMKVVEYDPSRTDYLMKGPKELESIISEITSAGELSEVTTQITEILNRIKEHFKGQDVVLSQSPKEKRAFHKILSTLGEIKGYISRGKKIQNINVNYINRHKVVYSLIRLKKEFTYLSEETQNNLSIQEIQENLEKVIGKIASKNVIKESGKQGIFAGKRQTIDTLEEVESQKGQVDFTNQVLDLDFLQNQKYHQYDDWREEIQSSLGLYNAGQISIQDCSELTKMILHGKSTLAIPVYNPRRIVTPPYTLSWDKIYKQSSKKELENALEVERIVKQQESWRDAEELEPELGKKVALQNLKYQLKYEKSKQEVVDLLLKFQFVDDLIAEHLEHTQSFKQNSQEGLLSRDPKCYFQYLNQKPYDHLLSSPYISYVFSKLAKKDRLKALLLSNKNRSKQLLHQARLNEITALEYNQQIQSMHQVAMKEIESYKSEILDEQFVILRDNTRLIVTPTVNEEELSRLLLLQLNPYNVEDDVDMMIGNGEYSEALDRKRFKEEQKLIRLRILLKTSKKEKLSGNEQKYLELWTSNGLEGEESYCFTGRTVGDLSQKDKQALERFPHSKDLVEKYSSLRLTDLILELGHCYSNAIVKQFEGRMLLKKCQEKYLSGGNTSFSSSFSSALDINQSLIVSNYLLELERVKFDQESRLNKQDVNNIIQISKFLKVEDPRNRERYQFVYQGIEEELEELNKLPNRNQAISEWYRIKEEEYDFSFKIAEQGKEKKQEEISKVWKELVGKGVKETNRSQLSKLVHTLCERLFVLRKNCPPYFSNLISTILTHPELNFADRCILLGSIELTKFPLTIDSEDILKLARVGASELPTAEEIKKKIQLSQSRFTAEQSAHLYV